MDASTSSQDRKLFDSYFLQIQNSHFPTQRQGCSIKYTKLPDFDFDMKVLWPQRDSYVLQPRLRRIITLNDQENILRMSRSLRSELGVPLNVMSSFTKRKIATISEVEEIEPRTVSKVGVKKLDSTRKPRKPVSYDEVNVPKTKSTISEPSRNLAKSNIKQGAKSSNIINNKRNNLSKQDSQSNALIANQQQRNSRLHFFKEKEKPPPKKKILEQSNISRYNLQTISRGSPSPPMERKFYNRNKSENIKNNTGSKLNLQKPKSPRPHRNEFIIFKDVPKSKNPKLIRVPPEDPRLSENKSQTPPDVDESLSTEDRYAGTDPEPKKIDVVTEVDPEITSKTNCYIQTDSIEMLGLNSQLGSLDVPSVSLIRDRSEESGLTLSKQSQSLPDLQMPSLKISPRKENRIPGEEMQIYKKDSFIIGRATLTYTTQQKIDFHVLGQSETNVTSPSSYPLTAVSAFKNKLKKNSLNENELARKKEQQKNKQKSNPAQDKSMRASKSLDCCYALNNSKLVKPSELISTIRVNNGLLQSDFICEQFQKELNFIDSFFESLQYLENCSSNNLLTDKKVENFVTQSGFDLKNPEYNSFFSKFENEENNEDSETMASKSLCLLNLLIRDEQRRAKNLLFVLKMREDALKDFTKSQILWLENKKKQENTDISTLKKKQRGALLKLQHECGEMQRMRKALLTLSEKRRIALMKTKKNIELKLKNNVKVDQIFLGKNKLKRNTNDRSTAPLKCFDLSSSGCDDSTTIRVKSDSALVNIETLPKVHFTEKSSQTGDSLLAPVTTDRQTDTTAENFITVDGGYLNILFQNLSLPEIFSSGKQYEVNEDALRSIVASVNSNRSAAITDSNLIERFIEKIKNCDQDLSSSPSTARSLVEELDQYYKNYTEEDKSGDVSPEKELSDPKHEEKPVDVSVGDCESQAQHSATCSEVSKVSASVNVDLKPLVCQMSSLERRVESAGCQAPAPPPSLPAELPSITSKHTHTESYQGESSIVIEMASLPVPTHSEAEELLRQQLAVEREIKALEQEQQHLLVVREIPDKPPPPYTPPTETRLPSTTRMYFVDETIEQKIRKRLTNASSETTDSSSAFDVFLADYCEESVQKLKVEASNYPWDACNLLPQKPLLDVEQLVEKTRTDLKEVLSGPTPVVVSGVSSRKSDHIDDILFAEWRRCEPEWTSLHAEEAQVKSQLFEAIFQRILNDTIDEYKKTVLDSDSDDTDDSVALTPTSQG